MVCQCGNHQCWKQGPKNPCPCYHGGTGCTDQCGCNPVTCRTKGDKADFALQPWKSIPLVDFTASVQNVLR